MKALANLHVLAKISELLVDTLADPETSTDASDTFLLRGGVILRNRKNLTIIHWFEDDSTRIQKIYCQESLETFHYWSVNCCCCRYQGNVIFMQLEFNKIFLNWGSWFLFSKLIQWSMGKYCPLFTKGFPGDSAKLQTKEKQLYENLLLHHEDTVTVSGFSPSPAVSEAILDFSILGHLSISSKPSL